MFTLPALSNAATASALAFAATVASVSAIYVNVIPAATLQNAQQNQL